MSRALAVTFLAAWAGATLLLSERRWFRRRGWVDRLAPHLPGQGNRSQAKGLLSVATFREVIAPLATTVGDLAGRGLGVNEDVSLRLERIHSPLDPTAFRVRQAAWSVGSLGVAVLVAVTAGPPPAVTVLLLAGAPALGFLVVEQQLAAASDRWQRRLFLELPVISEQIGMLLSAGYSLGGAMDRVARRGTGACAADLGRVGQRVRHGLSEAEALDEWAEIASTPAVDRLVGILALDRDTGDLGHLIAEEARSLRREAQRELMATIDRRAQQVWIPVTVATLLPGTLFLAVPFLEALSLYSA